MTNKKLHALFTSSLALVESASIRRWAAAQRQTFMDHSSEWSHLTPQSLSTFITLLAMG